ncbi:hypothetical protein AMATHDRAFT_9166 [Amanita thiersii Skay4041]|uniref:G-protein coupled receptors family 1 profile domain-containing protein n=1 Tax=Amanita thiersii Skay4041 TaxID=703135 RepID=A0A2A9NCH9_9AGAR|nr:hypothetical protein AMATHDRAFT_9166 [Amanita thiersii Skay4041]
MLSLLQTFTIGLFTETILYGLYLVTVLHMLRWLLFIDEGWALREKVNMFMLLPALAIFTLTTLDIAVSLLFSLALYRQESALSELSKSILAIIELLTPIIADGVLVYRCWIVYAKTWNAVLLPIATWLACIACFFAVLGLATRPGPISTTAGIVATVHLACVMATNLYTTSAIVLRIWRVAEQSKSAKRHLNFTIWVIVESGLLYTTTSAVYLVLQAISVTSKNASLYFISAITDSINFPTIGITFNLLLIRIAQHRADLNTRTVGTVPAGLSQVQNI